VSDVPHKTGRNFAPLAISARKKNLIALALTSLAFLLSSRFLLSDHHEGPIKLILPWGNELRLITCPFRAITGIPCPICGLTTSVTLMLRGDLYGSFSAHILGPFLVIGALATILYLPIALLSREPVSPREHNPSKKIALLTWAIWLLITAGWIINLAKHFIKGT